MSVENLVIPYNDFKLDTILDPEQFDINNARIQSKVNEVIAEVNTTIAKVTDLENTHAVLESSVDGNSGADYVRSTAITGVTGLTVQSQLESLKALIDGLNTRLTNAGF